jgi:hypothetical protein
VKRLIYNMVRLILVILPVLLAVEKSAAQTGLVLYEGQTSQMGVEVFPGYSYDWKIYDQTNLSHEATSDEVEILSPATGPILNVLWKKAGTYFYKITVHNENGCMNLKYGKAIVTESLPTATISPPSPICQGDTAQLNVTLTGQGPWRIILFDGINSTTLTNITSSAYLIPVSPVSNTTYKITQVTDANGTNTTPSLPVDLLIKPKPVSSHIYSY